MRKEGREGNEGQREEQVWRVASESEEPFACDFTIYSFLFLLYIFER